MRILYAALLSAVFMPCMPGQVPAPATADHEAVHARISAFGARLRRQPAIGNQIDVRYGPIAIGSKQFLLPLEATSIAPFGKRLAKAEMYFSGYRKYDSNSNITFDDAQ